MLKTISKATKNNWQRLHADFDGKLKARANKSMSEKRVVASSYLSTDNANRLLEHVSRCNEPLSDVMFTLCVDYLRHYNLWSLPHVVDTFNKLNHGCLVNLSITPNIWDDDNDLLGFVFQSLMTEGERWQSGQYYTSRRIAEYMVGNLNMKSHETFLDPCCGSGAFLMAVNTECPQQLYGFDINPIAVMIAATNMLVKYRHISFVPHVYCMDFLERGLFTAGNYDPDIPGCFDYIYTNPPWGTDKVDYYKDTYPEVKSKEKASMFLVQSLSKLNDSGTMNFLLPMSLLNIKTHQDIRRYIISHAAIQSIDLYDSRFDGVFTGYFSIKMTKKHVSPQQYTVNSATNSYAISLSTEEMKNSVIAYEPINEMDCSIIDKMESLRSDSLNHSQWALGIVTGNNKTRVKSSYQDNMEPVYAGKDISTLVIKNKTGYITFTPDEFQQCAREEYYRAPEKLIYRFIARYPVVAYDNCQRLCLNSANIVIPDVRGLSVKSVAVLLNSSLYRYYYTLKFNDIKVLKGNLQQLPFPRLTAEKNTQLTELCSQLMVSSVSDNKQKNIDKVVYNIFNITEEEQQYINSKLNNGGYTY